MGPLNIISVESNIEKYSHHNYYVFWVLVEGLFYWGGSHPPPPPPRPAFGRLGLGGLLVDAQFLWVNFSLYALSLQRWAWRSANT